MNKSYFLSLAAFLIFLSGISQSTWQTISSPVEEDLVSVCFIDSQNGYILSDQGSLLSTQDGGQNWQTSSLVEGTYTCLCMADADHGCALGYNDSSFIMITEDGGDSWQLPDHPKALRLNSTCFYDADIGWAVGILSNRNYQITTSDGGNNWQAQTTIFVQNAELFSVHFRNELSGSACGSEGAFFNTSNGGANWALDIAISSMGEEYYGLYNWGMFNGCVVGTSGTALWTNNRWADYIETTTNTDETLYAVSGAPSSGKLWAAGANGTIIHTPNYLLGWTDQISGTDEDLMDIQMLDENNGWAVGNNGKILKYGVGTGMPETGFNSFTFYPNPTHGKLKIIFQLNGDASVKLEIIDLHGRLVTTVLDDTRDEGKHLIGFNTSGLSEGIYFLRMKSGETLTTRKFIKVD